MGATDWKEEDFSGRGRKAVGGVLFRGKNGLQRTEGSSHANPNLKVTAMPGLVYRTLQRASFLTYLLPTAPLWSAAPACSVSAVVKVAVIWVPHA